MSLPSWEDSKSGGVMVRSALWLVQEVGEGKSFTKKQLRDAFPDTAQADRRIRDLRDFGWVIHTSADDVRLSQEEQRFVKQGVPVWIPKARREAAPAKISNKERDEVFERDDYMCTVCGISRGESYPEDSNQTAVLSVARRETVLANGLTNWSYATECKRCRAGLGDAQVRADGVLADIGKLNQHERRKLRQWMADGRRSVTALDRAWSGFLRLTPEAREEVRDAVED